MTSSSGRSTPSTANRTLRIDADIAPRAALLAAAATRMGATDAGIEQVLTTHRQGGVRLSDEELVNQMVEASQPVHARVTPVVPEVIAAFETSRETVPMTPPTKAKTTTPKRNRRA